MAVRTTAVVGTAAVVGRHAARSQQAQAAPAPAPEEVAAPAPEPSAGPTPDAIEQLKQIADLKDQGILTEDEFAAEKAKILAS
jgi:hypothetical protein